MASTTGGASGQGARSITASAAASVNPPSNTEHCSNADCSQGLSNCHDQSIAARSVAWRPVPPRPASSAKRSRRRSSELGRRQHGDARGCELDRERQPVEQARDLGHGGTLRVVEDEAGPLRLRAHDEELDRRPVQRQRLDRLHHLAGDVQAFAAGDHEGRLGRAVEPAADRGGGVLRDLLEVVEHDQAAAAAGDRLRELRRGIAGTEADAERAAGGVVDAVERRRLGEIAEPHAARPVAEPGMAVANGEPRLAGAALAEQGDEPRAFVEVARDRLQVGAAADEGVAFCRQMARDLAHRLPQVAAAHDAVRLVGVGRRREAAVRHGAELEHLDRLVDALQPVVAVAADLRRRVEAGAFERLPRRRAEQRLPAAGHGHHPGGERLREAFDLDRLRAERDVVGGRLAQHDRADMQAGACREAELGHRRVIVQRIARGIGGGVEEQQEAVGAVDLAPVVAAQQVARPAVVLGP